MKILTPDFEEKIFKALAEALAESRNVESYVWIRKEKVIEDKGFWILVFNYSAILSPSWGLNDSFILFIVDNALKQGFSVIENEKYYTYVFREGSVFATLSFVKVDYIRPRNEEEIALEKLLNVI